ncbi:MAG: D-alanyl-D-alanine carboxypeptidase [Cyanobacteria bacterium J06623_7]
MLDFLVLGIATWLGVFEPSKNELQPLEALSWEQSALFELPEFERDHLSAGVVESYLQTLASRGFEGERQGIWIQSEWDISARNRGLTPLPAASLTKIATTLATLSQWGAAHEFVTDVYLTGKLENGVVTGDIVIQGNSDPLFVWEEAIALGNALSQLGIREVRGNILVAGEFYMNFKSEPLVAGKLFRQALDKNLWTAPITQQYLQMPPGTKQPEILVTGTVKAIARQPKDTRQLIRHRSLPLAEILRQMNIYSNNKMAQMLANSVGGAQAVAQTSAEIAGIPTAEIKLINGSGLGEENQISPRAACQMLMAIDRLLQEHNYSAADLFPTAGRDVVGTLQGRGLPRGTSVKTGTLDSVSALAGVIPTSDRGNVYFSIINYGGSLKYLRQQQDRLLNELVQPWQLKPSNFDLSPEPKWYLGNPHRNKIGNFN